MAIEDKVIVNPTFRLDISGKLFKNKELNLNPQDTLLFNDLFTRLAIVKGDLPLFPDLGLKQHLFDFNFEDESQIAKSVSEFEEDVYIQVGRNCTIDYKLDKDFKNVNLSFILDGFTYRIDLQYKNINNSIRVIDYRFEDEV